MGNDKKDLVLSLGSWSKPAIRSLRNDLDALFEGMIRMFDFDRSDVKIFEDLQPQASFPKVNVSETDTAYNVEIAVAGFSKDDVKLELKDNDLIIRAEKKEEMEKEDKNYLRKEISSISFQRVVRFPCEVDAEKAEADYKDGIIVVSVNKIIKKEPCGVSIKVK